jgi:hypothetical protein
MLFALGAGIPRGLKSSAMTLPLTISPFGVACAGVSARMPLVKKRLGRCGMSGRRSKVSRIRGKYSPKSLVFEGEGTNGVWLASSLFMLAAWAAMAAAYLFL